MQWFKNTPPLIKVPFRYGVIAGLIGFVLLVSLYYMDRHPLLVPPQFDFRIIMFVVFLIFILRELREYYFEGLLFFWQGMSASFIFTFVFALTASTLLLIFTYWKPEFVTSFIQLSLEQIKTYSPEDINKLGKDVYNEVVRNIGLTSGYFIAKRYFFQSFLISFLISIVISVILRRQPKSI